MSSVWLNIRFYVWHLQIGDPHLWSIKISRNNYEIEREKPTTKVVGVCQ